MAARILVVIFSLWPLSLAVAQPRGGDAIAIQDLHLIIPGGWALHQNARDNGQLLLGFRSDERYLQFYVSSHVNDDIDKIFISMGVEVLNRQHLENHGITWRKLHTRFARGGHERYVSAFYAHLGGFTYYGYVAAQTLQQAEDSVNIFLQQISQG